MPLPQNGRGQGVSTSSGACRITDSQGGLPGSKPQAESTSIYIDERLIGYLTDDVCGQTRAKAADGADRGLYTTPLAAICALLESAR